MIVVAIIAYVVGLFAIMVLAMTFYGGLFEMVIGAARENRPVVFSDLFSGFKKFGSYAIFALVMAGIVIATSLLNIIPVLGTLAMIAILIWIEVMWLYVLPLIADQGLTFGEAQTRSRAMVKDVGWWKTFGHAHPADGRHLGGRHHHRHRLVAAQQGLVERRRGHRRAPVHRLRSRRRALRRSATSARCTWDPAESSSRPSPAPAATPSRPRRLRRRRRP